MGTCTGIVRATIRAPSLLAAVPAAGVERRLHVQARPLLPADNHVQAVRMSRGRAGEYPRQELASRRLPALLGSHHRLPDHIDLGALGRGRSGSKQPPKARKLSPAERRRRKRGRARS